MGISSVGLGTREIECITVVSGIITKSYQVGKNSLRVLVNNQHVLAAFVWSYVIIQVVGTAAEAIQEGYVYDVDSCRERLCNYWNNSTTLDSEFSSKYFESRCGSSDKEFQSSYSFMNCLQDLCKYTKSIGEKFYACPKLPEIPNKIVNFCTKLYPKKGAKYLNKLGELSYLNKCIKKLCNNKKIRPTLDKDILELCETKSVEKLYGFLKEINKSIKKLQKNVGKTDSWTQAGVIGAVVGGVAGIVGGAAGIASAIITYQAGRAATAAIGGTMVPTLSQGLQNIAQTTADNALALLRQTTSQVGEMIPMETLHSLHELSADIEEHSLSYYSVAEDPIQKVESGNPGAINELEIPKVLEPEAGGVDLLETGIGSNIIKNILSNFPSETTVETTELYSQTIRDSLDSSISSITQVSDLTKEWIAYMKNSLPYWQHSFCFYEKHIKLFVCRLPFPRHRSESKISFFTMEIYKFFSENLTSLCHYFHADLWCNWNQFLDLISSTRNVSFFMDKECSWDQFALKVNQVLNDTYRVDAIGNCHNETILIKV